MHWILANKEWIFSGIGVAIIGGIIGLIWKRKAGQSQRGGHHSTYIQASGDVNIGGNVGHDEGKHER